jgi:capsular exopolysaccharide synthesis family protein
MYTQFYGFSRKPFNVIPDPKFFHLTPCHRETLVSMMNGFDKGKGFISITGEAGLGKTTMVYTLLKHLKESGNTVFIFRANTTFKQLINNILLELKVPFTEDGEKPLLHILNEYLILRLFRDENIGIIVDEAQDLSKEVWDELRMLSNLEGPKSKFLQIALMGQPELEVMLDTKDLKEMKERIGMRVQLMPLSNEECIKYIDHYLNLAGSSSSKIFTPEAMSLIYFFTKGIPKTINALCDKAFQIGCSASQKKIDENIIYEVMKDMDSSILEKPAHPEPPLICFAIKLNPSLQPSPVKLKEDQKGPEEITESEPKPNSKPHGPVRLKISPNAKEEYHRMKYNILCINSAEKIKTLLFTSTTEGEGNSTVLINFAIALASEGDRVLLVDTNLRRPSFHNIFNVEREDGLTELVLEKVTLMYVIKETKFSNLSVITCGMAHPNPFSIFESNALDFHIEEMKAQADWVLFDSPPINSFNDSIALATKMDGIVMVVEAEKTRWEAVQHAKQRIESVKGNILGVVLNKRRFYIPEWLYRRL